MKNKKLKINLIILLLLTFVCVNSCDDLKSVEELAADASKEFCDCIKKKSLQDCEDDLNSRYSSNATNEKFISEFNRINYCGATIKRK